MSRVINTRLEHLANVALTAPWATGEPGMCDRWVFQVLYRGYGNAFENWRSHHSAARSLKLWRKSPFAVNPERGSVPGDILYWAREEGSNGHTGIRVYGNLLANNSISCKDKGFGARCLRKLETLGEPDLIVRIPFTLF